MTHEELIKMHEVVVEANDRSKSNTHRIDRMEKRQDNLDKLVTSVAVMAEKQEAMGETVEEIKTNVQDLKAKPAKRWESIVDKALMALVGALVAYALAKIGIV